MTSSQIQDGGRPLLWKTLRYVGISRWKNNRIAIKLLTLNHIGLRTVINTIGQKFKC